ncbi:MAG: globin domain-containing protein [Armatimonas sp.]
MTELQKELLRALLNDALAAPQNGEASLAALFYKQLFTVAPGVRELFHNSIRAQEVKFTQMLEHLRDGLDRPDNLVPLLWQTGRNHRHYGAEPAHYGVVGEVLLWALEQKLGAERLTPEVRVAWNELYGFVSLTMQEAAKA